VGRKFIEVNTGVAELGKVPQGTPGGVEIGEEFLGIGGGVRRGGRPRGPPRPDPSTSSRATRCRSCGAPAFIDVAMHDDGAVRRRLPKTTIDV
jgi:hypothetical protein